MILYGETTQEGEPTPDNPKPIENYVIIENKNGKKIKVPLEYIVRKEYKLKEGDQIKKLEMSGIYVGGVNNYVRRRNTKYFR